MKHASARPSTDTPCTARGFLRARFSALSFATFVTAGALPIIAAPAFPGAQGFGANASGARGSGASVYLVTNLNDSGAGSFRDAVSVSNRYVVFRVGGIINIDTRIIVKPNVYIAGQTAPGEGVTIYGNGLSYSNANNTVTRHIRYRMGVGGDSGKDCMTIAEGDKMMFDHVTTSWGRDETFSISGTASNITLQDCIVAMGLQTHSCGGLMETDGGVSIIRSLYIDNHTRNPKVKGKNEFVNNVVYNWGGGGGYILGDSAGISNANVINNYFINGPQTSISAFSRGNANFNVYASGNFQDSDRDGVLDGAVIPQSAYGTVTWKTSPYAYPTVSGLMTATQSVAHVIANAGATKPARDRVDKRYIQELQSYGTLGQIPTNENDAPISGPGPVAGGTAAADSDNDGMPDSWETANGMNPAVPDHNGDRDGDGYPNIEDYFNWLVGLDASGGTPGGGGGSPTTYQAESAVLGGSTVIESTNGGYTGSGYVNASANNGTTQFNNVQGGTTSGSKTVSFRHALASGSRTGTLTVNGVSQSITFNATGAWTTWGTLNVTVNLNAGTTNTLILRSTGADLANVDSLTVP